LAVGKKLAVSESGILKKGADFKVQSTTLQKRKVGLLLFLQLSRKGHACSQAGTCGYEPGVKHSNYPLYSSPDNIKSTKNKNNEATFV
jgi:hypothetical protein